MPQISNREHYDRMRRGLARYASLSRSPSPRRATTTSTYTPSRYTRVNRDAESSRAQADEPSTSQDVMPFHEWMYNLGHWHGFNEGTARVVEQTSCHNCRGPRLRYFLAWLDFMREELEENDWSFEEPPRTPHLASRYRRDSLDDLDFEGLYV